MRMLFRAFEEKIQFKKRLNKFLVDRLIRDY